ncbi:poly-gamma-glutamate biosynthesis protein [Serinibacter arcticus]|uniref:Poly-gamma-glutamate biosynthesis protein n=1 Tax=Serinibacter arcticus TaxID=1655435 RepID=A0A2U1ZT13_9MICO|nr:CapA family protein [Serinibacter arcticus]PWD50062.1 poly-gamma-glutamate biosynthesis protein [Serinibacter arcticus]
MTSRANRDPRSSEPRRPGRFTAGIVTVLAFAVLGVLGAAAATGTFSTPPAPTASTEPSTPPPSPEEPEPSETSPAPEPTTDPPSLPATFTILAAGDVLPHTTVQRNAETGDGGWDFSPLWEPVTPWVQAADLALCHLEVPVAPTGTDPVGYPVFGAPPAIVADLADGGWDGCSTASNHSVDMGRAGLEQTLDALDAAGMGHVGTARTEAEAAQPQLYQLEREGQVVTVAHLSATYGTNGLPIPSDAPWSVQLIDVDQLNAQAAAARESGADLVLASVHCCEEYTDTPVPRQVEIAQDLAAGGQIDLLIGNHSHVPQPMEMLPGGPGGSGMWVAYSMGNFISNQDENCCRSQTGTGTLMWATVERPPEGPARVTGLEWTAVPGDRLGAQRIYAMPDLLTERVDAPLLTLSRTELERRQQQVLDVIGTQVPERTEPPVPTGAAPVVVPRPR